MEFDVSPLALADAVDEGLPVSALNRIAALVAPNDANFAYRLVPRATLSRWRHAGSNAKLPTGISAKVARLDEIWVFAIEVWGSDSEARAFLTRSHPLLDGRVPLDVVLMNEFGGEAVRSILGRLHYSVAV